MSNDYFQFKQFIVFHDKCSMKVNTDGVLLGAWANVNNISNVLDIGTGSGLIALMIAQRSAAFIDAVEIDLPAYLQACENAGRSPWKDRITVHHEALQNYAPVCGKKYDLIVSNPPYFRNTLKSEDNRKSKARHDTELTFETMLYHADFLLNRKGRFCVILPYAEKDNFIELAHINHLYCQRIMQVKTTPVAPFSRILLLFSHDLTENMMKSDLTIHQENGQYSTEYIELTRDFYLAF